MPRQQLKQISKEESRRRIDLIALSEATEVSRWQQNSIGVRIEELKERLVSCAPEDFQRLQGEIAGLRFALNWHENMARGLEANIKEIESQEARARGHVALTPSA